MLIGAMAASMAACGNKGGSSAQTSAGKENQTTGSDENTLDVWAWDETFNIPALKAAEADYQASHPDFKLNIITKSSDDVQTAIVTAGGAGDYSTLPDISLQQDNNYTKNLEAYPEIFEDVSDIGITWDDFSADKLTKTTVDGRHYGVPVDNGVCMAAYRTDILEEAGYSIDDMTNASWADIITIGEDIYNKTGKYLFSSESTGNDFILIMLQAEGASLYTEDGSANIADNDTVKQCVEIMVEMIDKHVINMVNNWDEYIATFTNDTVIGCMNGNWMIPNIKQVEANSGKWKITTLPTLSGQPGYASNGGSSLFVSANSAKKELAEDFLKSTFGSSTATYDGALKDGGVISTYIPAGESDYYQQADEYFSGDPIYTTLVEYSSNIPVITDSPYHYEGREKLATAIIQIKEGTDTDTALKDAEDQLNQLMGK